MIRFAVLAFMAMIIATSSARAEDKEGHKIIVIKRDGTMTEFVVPADSPFPKEDEPQAAPKPEEEVFAPELEPKPAQKPVVQKASVVAPAVKPQIEEAVKSVRRGPPKPYRKPVVWKAGPRKPPLQPGALVTKDAAARIAFDVAPPARSFEVYARTYEGRPVYQVTFKTEEGYHDVLVDAETGAILKK